MKAVVVGATGNVGTSVVAALAEDPRVGSISAWRAASPRDGATHPMGPRRSAEETHGGIPGMLVRLDWALGFGRISISQEAVGHPAGPAATPPAAHRNPEGGQPCPADVPRVTYSEIRPRPGAGSQAASMILATRTQRPGPRRTRSSWAG